MWDIDETHGGLCRSLSHMIMTAHGVTGLGKIPKRLILRKKYSISLPNGVKMLPRGFTDDDAMIHLLMEQLTENICQ